MRSQARQRSGDVNTTEENEEQYEYHALDEERNTVDPNAADENLAGSSNETIIQRLHSALVYNVEEREWWLQLRNRILKESPEVCDPTITLQQVETMKLDLVYVHCFGEQFTKPCKEMILAWQMLKDEMANYRHTPQATGDEHRRRLFRIAQYAHLIRDKIDLLILFLICQQDQFNQDGIFKYACAFMIKFAEKVPLPTMDGVMPEERERLFAAFLESNIQKEPPSLIEEIQANASTLYDRVSAEVLTRYNFLSERVQRLFSDEPAQREVERASNSVSSGGSVS